MFLTESKEVFATGDNRNGQLGTEFPKTVSLTPLKINNLKNIIQLAASNFSAALSCSGDLYIWGAKQKLSDQSEALFKEKNNERMKTTLQENQNKSLWIPKKVNSSTQFSKISLGNGFGVGVRLGFGVEANISSSSFGVEIYSFSADVLKEMNFFEGEYVIL